MKIYLDKNSFSKTTVFSGFISRFETNMLMKNTEIDLVSRICDTWGKEELGGEREKEGSRKSPETMVCRGQEKRQEGIYKHKRRKDLNGIFIFLENKYWLIKSLFCWFPWFHYYLQKTIFNIPATIISSSWNVTALIATNDR
jgi:hypothetical protein